jgi:hypothetical protein
MITYIVCEGLADAQLLNFVLPKKLQNDVEVVAAGGLSAVKSLARSLVVRRQVPVAIVVDADSVVPEAVEDRRKNIEEIVKSVAGNTPVKVIVAVPEMEVIFFQDTSFLSRLLGYSPPQDVLDLAVFQPRKALEQLLSQSEKIHNRSQIINQLANEDTEIFRKTPFIQEIIHFLESVRETARAI